MEIENLKPEEEVAHIVSALINAYEGQNQKVVSLLHSEVLSNLSSLKHIISRGKRKQGEETDAEVMDLIDSISADLRIIQSEAYPVIVKHLTLRKCLAAISKDLESRYDVIIEHTDNIPLNREIEMSLNNKLNVIRLFKAVLLNFICEEAATNLQCSLNEINGQFHLEMKVINRNSIPRPFEEFFLVEKIDSVIARILSLQAHVHENTDWSNHVEIITPVTFKKS